ncbi:HPr kinase/phosphatase C-terminal domain-containing protein [Hoeflea sp. YIM 152468]|uniref:HPr kinase/phosphorylase n=1 Tax=Hoeflea sp. YIM 152468 TaxID=3031759 RepID=UPI0023DA6B61|nr:HPr kinase/phosphatase C-terminal domain-containing protein [Hoeflea sp. YIM 152468]MDF1610468.1 HPr kinase/phosphatase C-terminal domain-containing protein [Hoeflea sp. YIM 152468]
MTGASAGARETIHATAIVVGQTGLLFLGPSGSGKSSAAFACLAEAAAWGWNAALIADDRTMLMVQAGRIVASCPKPIRGLIEVRGSGIITTRHVDRAVMHCAVALTEPSPLSRLPAEHETFSCSAATIPLLRLWHDGAAGPLSRLLATSRPLFSGC